MSSGIVGQATFFLDAMPRDNAVTMGDLQEKIFKMLELENLLTTDESHMLQGIYRYYQQSNKLSKRQVFTVLNIWERKFKQIVTDIK